MADWYIDHGYTGYPTAYMSAPASAASLPQEGDGKASGTGATPAVASAVWDLTSSSASSGTMTVMGAVLTGLTASGAALASAIATAINASTAAVTASTGGLSSPYLRALVWASASGAILTVYTRIASADLNYDASTAPNARMIAGTGWTSAPANASFSGGVSGPWSLFFNTSALANAVNASISAAGTYGGITATMMGAPTGGDVIHVRTGRANANITLPVGSTAITVNTRSVGSPTSYLEVRGDNGTIWNDGASSGVFTIDRSLTGNNTYFYVNGFTHLRGQMKAGTSVNTGGTANIRFRASSAESAGLVYSVYYTALESSSRHSIFDTVDFEDTGAGTAWVLNVRARPEHQDNTVPARFVNCRFGHVVRGGSTNACVFNPENFAVGMNVEAVDCLFAFGSSVTTYSNALYYYNTGVFGRHVGINIKLVRPKFTGGGGGHHSLVLWSTQTAFAASITIEDPVDMGQFIASDSAASCCGRAVFIGGNSTSSAHREITGQFISSTTGTRDFLIDTPMRLLEWRQAGFPTSGVSLLPDGTPFSVRFSVPGTGTAANLVTRMRPAQGIRQVVTNTLGDSASLTITERFLVDTLYGGASYTPTDAEWWVEGKYVATDGSLRTFSTKGAGTTLTADTTNWSSLTFAPFGGGVRSYSRWRISTTITDVKADTDVSLTLMCAKQPSTMAEWAFIDPQFTLT